jgi:hypothetical protein
MINHHHCEGRTKDVTLPACLATVMARNEAIRYRASGRDAFCPLSFTITSLDLFYRSR